ncbi:hypothetical protein MPTK1_1g23850 [Marchantia polymorpha subsp. ruderalis]|uniref:Uncharacterized protein n=2 Tax=Marchantia polymorpha TaxID=3197 RepID=A0AAF6ATL9_MARPO|nr:hypothetical protein MARPO_0061s0135 [Marchantia polymorpha]BBM99789.1 hypothetical protein Mp_1g23850 [Marchantia polymorpha subsp. ruderalis]|eukprot:PTQ36895.1 hypothetical protein MARPO_0061s0135 [Marchantia polymorpha]
MDSRPPPPPPPPLGTASKPPSAKELIEFYKKKGLNQEAATEKAIEDMQKALTYAVQRFPKRAQAVEKSIVSVSSGMDRLAKRMDTLEAKLDTKPSFVGVFAAGAAAGAALQAVFSGVPHLIRAVSQVGRSISGAGFPARM